MNTNYNQHQPPGPKNKKDHEELIGDDFIDEPNTHALDIEDLDDVIEPEEIDDLEPEDLDDDEEDI